MNALELADELERLQKIYPLFSPLVLGETATRLRQLQTERDLLFRVHSHEMVRADELQIECDRLYRIVELIGGAT